MNWWQNVLLVLGGVAGFALIGKWLLTGSFAWLSKTLKSAGVCEFCFKQPATLEIDLRDDGGPIKSCDGCFAVKGSPYFRQHLRDQGRVKPITSSVALEHAERKAAGR